MGKAIYLSHTISGILFPALGKTVLMGKLFSFCLGTVEKFPSTADGVGGKKATGRLARA
jgi:hypothetical protein